VQAAVALGNGSTYVYHVGFYERFLGLRSLRNYWNNIIFHSYLEELIIVLSY
jgi:hypothetical protein